MATSPTLSVWMPNFNHSAYLERAISAVANQSYRPDEFVIVDDASTDTSREVLERCTQRYPWVRVVFLDKNRGVLSIMQQAVREHTGSYLFLTSADDYVMPGFFEQAMNGAKQFPQAGIIFGQMNVESDVGGKLYIGKATYFATSQYVSPDQYLERYMKYEAPNHSLSAATIYKSTALQDIDGFRQDLGPWGDTFAIQAIARTSGAYYIAQPCATWVVHSASMSQAVRKNPFHMFGVLSRAARIMSSKQFAPLFPQSYVHSWIRRYRFAIVIQYMTQLLEFLGIQGIATTPVLQRWYQGMLRKLL